MVFSLIFTDYNVSTPLQVFGCIWDQDNGNGEERFLTFGVRHIKIWTASTKQTIYKSFTCSWSGATPRSTLCAAFLPEQLQSSTELKSNTERFCSVSSMGSGGFVTGHLDGKIRFWKENCCIRDVQCHKMFGNVREDFDCSGNPTELVMSRQGVRCVKILEVPVNQADKETSNSNLFLMATGGADGILKVWSMGGANGQVGNC